MSLEPAFALLVGLLVLGQVPALLAVVGIGFVVAAGVGAERSGARSDHVPVDPASDAASRRRASRRPLEKAPSA